MDKILERIINNEMPKCSIKTHSLDLAEPIEIYTKGAMSSFAIKIAQIIIKAISFNRKDAIAIISDINSKAQHSYCDTVSLCLKTLENIKEQKMKELI